MNRNSRVTDFHTKVLPYEAHERFYKALLHNDTNQLLGVLSQASAPEKSSLINGEFCVEGKLNFSSPILKRMTRPLLVAAMVGSVEVVELLVKHGANVFQENAFHENIFHSVVAASSLEVIFEKRAVSVFKRITETFHKGETYKLLLAENNNGLRPLEMAANLGCVLLYETIQMTPGVYLTKAINVGLLREDWIDITEYQSCKSGNRRTKAPLAMFCHLDKKIALQKKHGSISECDIVTIWIERKIRSLQHLIWATGSFLTLAVEYFMAILTKRTRRGQHFSQSNLTDGCRGESFYFPISDKVYKVLIYLFLIYPVYHLIFTPKPYCLFLINFKNIYNKTLTRTKELFVQNIFHSVFHYLQCVSWLMVGILFLLDVPETDTTLNILLSYNCTVYSWSVLYMLQISLRIGHFTTALQRMVFVLLQFCIIFAIIFVPFVHLFYRLLQGQDGCSNPHFSPSIFENCYNTLIVIFNMIDFHQYKEETGDSYYTLLIVHVVFVFLFQILLINFLIALFSHSMAEVMETKTSFLTVQKLNVLFMLESIFAEVLLLGKKLANYVLTKGFVVQNGHVYLIRTTCESDSKTALK